jgi:hypothetical protein
VIYPAALDRDLQFTLAAVVLLVNLAVYGVLARHWLGQKRRRAA